MGNIDNKYLLDEYKSRINRVLDYIETNIEKQLDLEELASVANFSKFHFHRIFQGMVGETPYQFILRIRLERAASCLLINPKKCITDIALEMGFSDLSNFSRNFKSFFNISATEWRKSKYFYNNHIADKNSKNKQTKSKTIQAEEMPSMYFCRESKTIKWRTNMKINKSVEVKEFPKMTLAYVRHTGPYKGNGNLFAGLWNKLFSWAGPRGLTQQPDMKSLVLYHDDPNITDADKLRLSVCITVPKDTKVDGEVGKMGIDGGKYVVARFEISEKEFEQAWGWVYGSWFPSSGFQPDDGPCFEMYPEEPKNGKFVVDICVPVKPL
jgi:AraC family transcriptional regulator